MKQKRRQGWRMGWVWTVELAEALRSSGSDVMASLVSIVYGSVDSDTDSNTYPHLVKQIPLSREQCLGRCNHRIRTLLGRDKNLFPSANRRVKL